MLFSRLHNPPSSLPAYLSLITRRDSLLSNRNHVAKQSSPTTNIRAIGPRSSLSSGKRGLSGTRQSATTTTSLLGLVLSFVDLAPYEFCFSKDRVDVSRITPLLRTIWSITAIRFVRPSTAGAAATRRGSRRIGETPSTAVVDLLVRLDLLGPNLVLLFATATCNNRTVRFLARHIVTLSRHPLY
jgi:hypothetical protein